MVHFTNRNLQPLSEFSTIDTAECVLGALFAGNYFGGEVLNLALQLKEATKWSDALEASDSGRIYPVVDPETGVFSGVISPYNEYYLVAYMANMTSEAGSKANVHFETYWSSSGRPPGDGDNPVWKTYQGYELLTDWDQIFMSSFIPLFNSYMSRGYMSNQYYVDMNTRYCWWIMNLVLHLHSWTLVLSPKRDKKYSSRFMQCKKFPRFLFLL